MGSSGNGWCEVQTDTGWPSEVAVGTSGGCCAACVVVSVKVCVGGKGVKTKLSLSLTHTHTQRHTCALCLPEDTMASSGFLQNQSEGQVSNSQTGMCDLGEGAVSTVSSAWPGEDGTLRGEVVLWVSRLGPG